MSHFNVLSTTPVSVGSSITTITIESTSTQAQTNVPVTFGHHFSKGHLPFAEASVALRSGTTNIQCQLDIKTTHKDGSVRFAIVSAIIPSIASGAAVTYDILRASSKPVGAAPVPGDYPSLTAVVTIKDNGIDVAGPNAGKVYTADAAPLLAAGNYKTWLAGPIVSQWDLRVPLKDAGGVEHPDLHVRYYIRAYKNNSKVKVDYCVEHSWAKPKKVPSGTTPWETVGVLPIVHAVNVTISGNTVFEHSMNGHHRVGVPGVSSTGSSVSTLIPNDSLTYTASVTIDGVVKPISVAGSAIQNFGQLYAAVTAQLGTAGVCKIDDRAFGIFIESVTTGPNSKVTITNYGTLFNGLQSTGLTSSTATTYTAVITVNGTDYPISIASNTAYSFAQLCKAINTQLAGVVVATPKGDGIGVRLVSIATGLETGITVNEGTLFAITKTKLLKPYRPIRGDEYIQYPRQRWKQTHWVNGEPSIHIRHDKNYLIDSLVVPNYPKTLVAHQPTIASNLAKVKANEYIGEPGMGKRVMPGPGYSANIGILPEWTALYLADLGKDSKYVMLKMADLSGSWNAFVREYDTDLPVDFLKWPKATITGTTGDSKNSITGLSEKLPSIVEPSQIPRIRNTADVAHHPDFFFVPYLVTGDSFYMEGLIMYFSNTCLTQNPAGAYRDGGKVLFKREQVRGQAWMIRSMNHNRYLLPDDHACRPMLEHIAKSNVDWYNTNTVSPTGVNHSFFGHLGGLEYSVNGVSDVGSSFFMEDFVTAICGRSVELGFEEFLPLLTYKSRSIKGRLTSGTEYCWQWATAYVMRYRDTATSPEYTSWRQAYENTIPYVSAATANVLSYQCGSVEMGNITEGQNNFPGYPHWLGGRAANMQPAVAYCAMFDMPSAQDAWLVYENRATKQDFHKGPQFAIEPRTFLATSSPGDTPDDPTPVGDLPRDAYTTLEGSVLYIGRNP